MLLLRNRTVVRMCAVLALALSMGVSTSAAADYSFLNVDYPGAVWTVPTKINTAGQIVGQFLDAGGTRHGFLYSNGIYRIIDCPEPYTTQSSATGINNSGQIVGFCSAPGGINGVYGTTRSFLLSGGVLTFLPDLPGSYNGASTFALSLNDNGQIVGWAADACLCGARGFLFENGAHTPLQVPGFGSTTAIDINNLGQIVGATQPGFGTGGDRGFLLSGGSYTLIDAPPVGVVTTELHGINDSGVIVGLTRNPTTGAVLGLSLTNGVFTTFDLPDSQLTEPLGINSLGVIVGVYIDLAGAQHGFVTTSPAPAYTALVQQPINSDESSVFNANRGVIPVKFTLAQDGTATCQLPPATISVFRTSNGSTAEVNQNQFLMPSDTGSNFRTNLDNCEYVYNLGVKTLGPGTYLVRIAISGTSVGSAAFGLR
jgi:probable HAF family extracellular repeat protein